MSYIYLQEQGEESSAERFSDIPQFVLSRLNLTAGKFSCNDSAMESCQSFPSGMTCEHSTASRGAGLSMSCAEDSHAPTYQQLTTRGLELTEASTQDCGEKCPELFARFDRLTSSWKTRQCSLIEGLEASWVTWPRWGLMLHGECLELAMPDYFTNENVFGLLPTPLTNPSKRQLDENGNSVSAKGQRYGTSLYQLAGGHPCPQFQEWLMGWPPGWTGTEPLATAKFRQWLRSHGESSAAKTSYL